MNFIKDIATLEPGQEVRIESMTLSSGREYSQKLYFASISNGIAAFDKSKEWALKDLGTVFVNTKTATITGGNSNKQIRHNAMVYA